MKQIGGYSPLVLFFSPACTVESTTGLKSTMIFFKKVLGVVRLHRLLLSQAQSLKRLHIHLHVLNRILRIYCLSNVVPIPRRANDHNDNLKGA